MISKRIFEDREHISIIDVKIKSLIK